MKNGISVRLFAIFDMDGVLVDSVKLNWLAMNNVLANYHITIPDTEIKKYLGRTLEDQVAQFNEDFALNLDYDEFNAATQTIKTALLSHLVPKDGVTDLLSQLKAVHIPVAVATSMPRELTIQRLRTAGLTNYFDTMVTEEDVTEHKPSPQVFVEAAAALSGNPSRCIVFEDAPAGIEAAKNAGMKCIAVQTAYVLPMDLRRADFVVSSLSQVDLSLMEYLINAS